MSHLAFEGIKHITLHNWKDYLDRTLPLFPPRISQETLSDAPDEIDNFFNCITTSYPYLITYIATTNKIAELLHDNPYSLLGMLFDYPLESLSYEDLSTKLLKLLADQIDTYNSAPTLQHQQYAITVNRFVKNFFKDKLKTLQSLFKDTCRVAYPTTSNEKKYEILHHIARIEQLGSDYFPFVQEDIVIDFSDLKLGILQSIELPAAPPVPMEFSQSLERKRTHDNVDDDDHHQVNRMRLDPPSN